jgi:hypothetical protein
MTFLTPFFLWMLPLASVPALIHLWNKYRVKEIEFSTISFLKIMESKSIKKVKLIELLLLILRTLIILLILLFISRPVIRGEFSNWVYNPQSTITAIIIDDSFSMNGIRNGKETQKLLESAIVNIKKSLVPHQKVIFGSFSKGIQFIGLLEEFYNFKPQIKLTELNFGISNILEQLNDTINHEVINKELYILTDLQANTFTIENNRVANDWNTFILKLDIPDENLAIKGMEIKSEIVLPNESFEVSVSIINNGKLPQFQRMIILNIDGLDIGQQLVSLDPNEGKVITFHTALPSTGKFKLIAELDHDDLIKDNSWYKIINIPNKLNIGLFSNYPEDLLYLNHTLSAINDDQNIFKIIEFPLKQISHTDLNKFELLFISGTLNLNQWNELKLFINWGKHAIVFPSSKENEYQIFNNNKLTSHELVNLTEDNFLLVHSENVENIKDVAIQKFVQNKTVQPKFFKYYNLNEFKNSQLNLEGNSSIWVREYNNNGFIDILGFGLTPDWSNLPFLAGFIPFLHNWIYSGKTISSYPEYNVGMKLNKKSFQHNSNEKIEISSPENFNYLISFNEKGEASEFKLNKTGFYNLKIDNKLNKILAVNPSINELNSTILNISDINNLFNKYKIIKLENEFTEEIKTAKIGTEIGTQLLLFIFLLLIIESFIAQLKPNQGKNN